MSVNFIRDIQGSWTSEKSPARTIKDIVVEPWGPALLKEKMDDEGYITVVILVDFWDLLEFGSIDGLNDIAETTIIHDSCMGYAGLMEDISYRVVGFKPSNSDGAGAVYIEVHGYVGEIVEGWEQDQADETNKFADSVMTTSGGTDEIPSTRA